MVLSSYPRYSYRLYSIPFGPTWLKAINFQIKFIEHLCKEVKAELIIRPYMKDMGWNEAKRFNDQFPEISIDSKSTSWKNVLRNSKLIIETNNQTTFLESIACNIPTVIILQEKYWEMTTEAKQHFKEMEKVNMLFTEAKNAALFINDIYHDPSQWWNRKDVQDVKNKFCEQYANSSDNWLRAWTKEIQKQLL